MGTTSTAVPSDLGRSSASCRAPVDTEEAKGKKVSASSLRSLPDPEALVSAIPTSTLRLRSFKIGEGRMLCWPIPPPVPVAGALTVRRRFSLS
jgi:hypothetical protein